MRLHLCRQLILVLACAHVGVFTLYAANEDPLASLGLGSSKKTQPKPSAQKQTPSLPKNTSSSLTAPELLKKTTTGSSNTQLLMLQAPPSLSLDNAVAHQVLTADSSTPAQKLSVITRRNTDSSVPAQALDADPATAGAQQITFLNKKTPPKGVDVVMNLGTASFTQTKKQPTPFKPSGDITSDGNINALYKEFIESISTTVDNSGASFLPIFTKLHLVALHQIYNYLMGVYASLNMTHIDDVQSYVALESVYGLNAKTLIINHLIGIIEAQLNQALRSLFPAMPRDQATHAGMMCIESDKASRPDLLIVDVEQVVLQMFETNAITPDQWTSVLNNLVDPEHTDILQKITDQSSLAAATKKLDQFLNSSMDLGGKTGYEESIRTAFSKDPERSLFSGKVPSARAWQEVMNKLSSATTDETKIPSYVSCAQQLTPQERFALIDTLDLLTAHFSSNQRMQDTTLLLKMLSGSVPEIDLSVGQYTLLTDLVKTVSFAGPIEQQITNLKKIAANLSGAQPLTEDEKQTLQGMVAYCALRIEKDTASAINQTVAKVQSLIKDRISELSDKERTIFLRLSGLTALERGELRIIAQQLFTPDKKLSSVALTRLEAREKKLFITGFNDYKQQEPSLSDAQRSLLESVVQALSAENFDLAQLSQGQRDALLNALSKFIAYDAGTYTYQQAEQDMYALFDKTAFDKATEKLDAKNETLFAQYKPSELLMLLGSFQGAGRVVESRIANHEKQAALFASLFESEPQLQRQLYWALGSNEYGHLIGIGNLLDTTQTPDKQPTGQKDETLYAQAEELDALLNSSTLKNSFSLASLSPNKRTILADLIALFIAPPQGKMPLAQENAADLSAQKTMSSGFLEMIQDLHMSDPFISQLLTLPHAADFQFLHTLFDTATAPNMQLSSFNAEQKQFLKTMLEAYQAILEKEDGGAQDHTPSSQTETRGLQGATHPLSDEDHINISGVASILHAFSHITETQTAFLKTLGAYLNFFTPYTATLKDADDSKTKGLSKFANTAQKIAAEMKNTPAQTINPPLFFYDKETLRSIKILPFLARSIEGTQSVPYPTFAVDLVLSANPLSSNPLENNQVQLDTGTAITVPSLTVKSQGAPYSPRFFIKDEQGNPLANESRLNFGSSSKTSTGQFTQEVFKNQTVAWLEKRTVPIQDPANPGHIYTPTKTAKKGHAGLFTNIPVISRDPARKDGVLVRLYEQELKGQPEWLNSEQGILKMIRICMGDFASGLTLDETLFDPVLHFIFMKALKTTKVPQELSSASLDLSEANLARLEQQCNLYLIQEHLDLAAQQNSVKAVTTNGAA